MKNSILLIITTLMFNLSYSQETYFTRFFIKEKFKTEYGNDVNLVQDVEVSFEDLSIKKRKEYIEIIEKNRGGELKVDKKIGELTIQETITIPAKGESIDYDKLLKDVKFKTQKNITINGKKKSYVKFEKDKVIVNPWLTINGNQDKSISRELYYYKLENRQKISLRFKELSLSGLTIPLKYRFKNSDKDLKEQFGTSFNANLFVGWTFYGKRSFMYRKNVENRSNTFRATFGGFLGASTVKLNNSNTKLSNDPIQEDTEITEGLASIGLGFNFAFNKLNFGIFVGWDYSVGENADKWNYNKEPWIGLALGYSLLKI
nr:hypothetical protein [uncultured Psychroserpens sp.]